MRNQARDAFVTNWPLASGGMDGVLAHVATPSPYVRDGVQNTKQSACNVCLHLVAELTSILDIRAVAGFAVLFGVVAKWRARRDSNS
jgi:hypothetical protein